MIRSNWHIVLLLFLLLTAENCKKQEESTFNLSQVQGKLWLNSYEEDSSGFRAYRPEDYNFPPSRGRSGFKIEKDSIFIEYAIAPADGWQKNYGKIRKSEENKFKIIFDSGKPPITFEVIKGSKDFLLINQVKH